MTATGDWVDQRTQAHFEPIHRRRLLTPRQIQVLALAAEGLTDQAIATELWISIRTVRTHMQDIRDRLGVTSRTYAVILAIRAGLIPLDPAHPEWAIPPPALVIVTPGATR